MWSVLSPVPVRKGQNGLWTGLKDFSRLSAALIAKAVYKGIVRGFDFTSYVMIHQQAHQDLTRLGRPVPEGKKIRDFLNGITDPQFISIKLNVLANPVFMNDISLAINYIASAIDLTIKNANQSNRQILDIPEEEVISIEGEEAMVDKEEERIKEVAVDPEAEEEDMYHGLTTTTVIRMKINHYQEVTLEKNGGIYRVLNIIGYIELGIV
jgi:PAS domain-containing protein